MIVRMSASMSNFSDIRVPVSTVQHCEHDHHHDRTSTMTTHVEAIPMYVKELLLQLTCHQQTLVNSILAIVAIDSIGKP